MGPVCDLDHLRTEEYQCVAVADPLTQPGAACIDRAFDPIMGGMGEGGTDDGGRTCD